MYYHQISILFNSILELLNWKFFFKEEHYPSLIEDYNFDISLTIKIYAYINLFLYITLHLSVFSFPLPLQRIQSLFRFGWCTQSRYNPQGKDFLTITCQVFLSFQLWRTKTILLLSRWMSYYKEVYPGILLTTCLLVYITIVYF